MYRPVLSLSTDSSLCCHSSLTQLGANIWVIIINNNLTDDDDDIARPNCIIAQVSILPRKLCYLNCN